MKKHIKCMMAVFALAACMYACAQGDREERQVVAKINEFELTLNEFEAQLVEELEFEDDYKLTKEAKQELLEQMIREEILIQEAVKFKLDRKEKFIKAIERYWKATLIRDLMEMMGESFDRTTYVTEEEIEARYQKMKKDYTEILSFDELRQSISKELKEEKKRQRLAAWMDDLRAYAEVSIDEDLLEQ